MGLGWSGRRVGTSLGRRDSFTDMLTLPGSLLLTFTCCLVAKSGPVLCDPMGLRPTRLLRSWDSPGKNTGVGCHFILQGIFPIQGSNPGCLHYRQILYSLSHQGSPKRKHSILPNFFFCMNRVSSQTEPLRAVMPTARINRKSLKTSTREKERDQNT